jgi:hypothetical protein
MSDCAVRLYITSIHPPGAAPPYCASGAACGLPASGAHPCVSRALPSGFVLRRQDALPPASPTRATLAAAHPPVPVNTTISSIPQGMRLVHSDAVVTNGGIAIGAMSALWAALLPIEVTVYAVAASVSSCDGCPPKWRQILHSCRIYCNMIGIRSSAHQASAASSR